MQASQNLELILASSSPQRIEILNSVGISARCVSPDIDESQLSGESSRQLVMRLAETKAKHVASLLSKSESVEDCVFLAADSVVDLDGEVLGKPKDDTEAFSMLSSLSGRSHLVFTGVAIVFAGEVRVDVSETVVWLRDISDSDLHAYIASGESVGRAGGCCVQGRGAVFVDRFEGSFHNVVGLPISLVDEMLDGMGLSLSTFLSVSESV